MGPDNLAKERNLRDYKIKVAKSKRWYMAKAMAFKMRMIKRAKET